jgi:hyperosmotically inducible protein
MRRTTIFRCKRQFFRGMRIRLRRWHLQSYLPQLPPMKISRSLLIALIAASPVCLWADPAMDRKIEDAAASSYNFRAVLEKQVTVKAEDGVVTLTGTVLDRDQKALAEETVRGLPGVIDVRNQLDVTSPGPERSDGWIALKIRSVLLLRSNVSATDTDVAVRDGNVTLSGTAENEAQKELTGIYAQEVEGVKSLKNEITVVPQVASENRTLGEKIDDTSITAQVKYALLTHRMTSALKTNVDTKEGSVVIRGTAGSEAEKELVTKLARSVRGVAVVDNHMTVQASVAE